MPARRCQLGIQKEPRVKGFYKYKLNLPGVRARGEGRWEQEAPTSPFEYGGECDAMRNGSRTSGVKNEFGQGISLLVGVLSSAEMYGGKWDCAGSQPGLPLPGVTHNAGHRGDSGDDLKVH